MVIKYTFILILNWLNSFYKYSLKELKLLIFKFLIFSSLNYKLLACTQPIDDNKDVFDWLLGNKSKFSEYFKEGKCALDNALTNLSAYEIWKKGIANLLAKSYSLGARTLNYLKI